MYSLTYLRKVDPKGKPKVKGNMENQETGITGNNAAIPTEDAIKYHVGRLAELTGITPPNDHLDELLKKKTAENEIQRDAPADDILLQIALEDLGLHEEDNRDELIIKFKDRDITDWLGKVLDPNKLPWCAGYFDYLLAKAGLPKVGSLAAKDFHRIGKMKPDTTLPPKPGYATMWDNHIAVFAGWANKAELANLKTPFKVTNIDDWKNLYDPDGDTEMVIGGNQGDRVNISPKYLSLIHI